AGAVAASRRKVLSGCLAAGRAGRSIVRKNQKTCCLMGFLKRFFKGHATIQQLPAGSLTVNRDGKVVTSTIVSGYPQGLLRDIVRDVLLLFRQAREAQMPLAEFS